MSGEIDRANRTLVHKKDYLAARTGKAWPIAGKHSLVERIVIPPDIVRCNELFGRKYGAYLGIKSVEGCCGKGFGLGEVKITPRFTLFCLDQDEDRDVVRMSTRPLPNLLQTAGKRLTSAAIVEVLNMHDLETWLSHYSVRIEVRIGWKMSSSDGCRT